jgi:hypothetical protein
VLAADRPPRASINRRQIRRRIMRFRPSPCLVALGITLAASSIAAAFAEDRVEKLLETLADAPGPSGYEEAVRAIVVRELKPLAAHLSYDGLGSVIAEHGASGPKIMLDAHMDELGGVIRRVTPEGFLSMQMLGGLDRSGASRPALVDHHLEGARARGNGAARRSPDPAR